MTLYVMTTNGNVIEFPDAEYWNTLKGGRIRLRTRRRGDIIATLQKSNIIGVFENSEFNIEGGNSNG